MKNTVKTIVLAIIAIAAIVWACSYKMSGLAWFPGFIVAVFCGIKILEVHEIEEKKTRNC